MLLLQGSGSHQTQLPQKTEASATIVKLEAPGPNEAMDSGARKEQKRIFSIRLAGRPKCVTARMEKQKFRCLVYTGAEASDIRPETFCVCCACYIDRVLWSIQRVALCIDRGLWSIRHVALCRYYRVKTS